MLQRTNIYLPDEMIAFLKTQAEMEKVTMSDIVRRELAASIRQKKTNWAQSLLELSKRAPRPKIKIPDLSKRHDYYLYIEPYERRQKQLRVRMKRKKGR